ncbi:MAG TPA: succinylglutamate desuccinylase/aspartoacylase family protein [Bacteroidia bacterium]|nr:succinylglutamate desuccinylase/aspartoacylase family protein [Bacteroidia bacterium]
MSSIKIHQETIALGENKIVSLNTYELPTKTKIEIPIYVFRSQLPGPTVLLSAGMHGDEINGIEVIRKIIIRKEIQNLLCGTLIAIPVMNTVSFLYQSRDLPDGRDLNRCFPGTKNGSLGSRIAYDLMKEIIPLIDVGIDFHTGGAKISNYPQLRCTFEDETSLRIAQLFSPPLIINSVYREHTLRKEAAKKNKPILVFEGGESLRFDYQAINEGLNGCLRLLHHHKMIKDEIPPNPYVQLKKSAWVRAKLSGLFHISKPNGAYVNKDEILGAICNPFGQVEARITSPFDGYIVGVNNQPVVNQGDALIHIGTED